MSSLARAVISWNPSLLFLRSAPYREQFKVLLFNDNGNTREYVSRSLVQVVGLPEATAFHIMQQVRNLPLAVRIICFGVCRLAIACGGPGALDSWTHDGHRRLPLCFPLFFRWL